MGRYVEPLISKTVRLPQSYVDLINSFPGVTFTGKLLQLINIALDNLDNQNLEELNLDDQDPEEEVPFT